MKWKTAIFRFNFFIQLNSWTNNVVSWSIVKHEHNRRYKLILEICLSKGFASIRLIISIFHRLIGQYFESGILFISLANLHGGKRWLDVWERRRQAPLYSNQTPRWVWNAYFDLAILYSSKIKIYQTRKWTSEHFDNALKQIIHICCPGNLEIMLSFVLTFDKIVPKMVFLDKNCHFSHRFLIKRVKWRIKNL